MEYTNSISRGVLACAIAFAFAAPSLAQVIPAKTKTLEQKIEEIKTAHQQITTDAKAAADKAAAAAKVAAETHTAAAKTAALLKAGGVANGPPKVFPVPFNVAVVQPYVDDMNRMAAEMKGVTTPQQAAAYAAYLQKDLPRLDANITKLHSAMAHIIDGMSSGKMTPEMTQAATLLGNNSSEARGQAMDAEMNRIAKLSPTVIAPFKTVVAMHDAL